jgi:hypothetical protein
MDLLQRALGGPETQAEYEDFIDRFKKGSPYDSIDDREAIGRYDSVTPDLSNSDYRDAAAETFDQLSPQERAEFSRWLRTRATANGVQVPDYDLNDDGLDDRLQGSPGDLAEVTTRVREQDPNIFEQVLGKGGTGGPLDNPIVKAVVAGIAAMAAQRILGRR